MRYTFVQSGTNFQFKLEWQQTYRKISDLVLVFKHLLIIGCTYFINVPAHPNEDLNYWAMVENYFQFVGFELLKTIVKGL